MYRPSFHVSHKLPCVAHVSMSPTTSHVPRKLTYAPKLPCVPLVSMCHDVSKRRCVPQASIWSSPSFHVPPKLPIAPQASMCPTSIYVPPKLTCTSKHPCAPQASKKSPELTTTTLNFLIPSYFFLYRFTIKLIDWNLNALIKWSIKLLLHSI